MMPVYSSMDSHPYQRNQMAFPHYCTPGIETIPPQMNMDPSKPPFAYEQPWPYTSSYGHPTPMHFCCGYNNFPGYCSHRPAYPHIPSPSSMYLSGGYPAYAQPFCAPYASPPHYTMELPRYEYDKCMSRGHHCCGCPNYPLNPKEGNNVKIEEHQPDIEKKLNDAVVPSQLKNCPYPVVWIPPEYMGNREPRKPVAAEVGDKDKIEQNRKPPEYVRADRQEPKGWNGWFPSDINSLSNMLQDGNGRRNQNWQIDNTKRESGDGRTNQDEQSENKRREFPFPFIWMPYYNMQDGERTNNQESVSTPKSIQEVTPTVNSVPVNSHSGDDVTNRNSAKGSEPNIGSSDVTGEVANEKSIPLKQTELQQAKNDSEGTNRIVKIIPVKQAEVNVTDKESQINEKSQSPSPRKASKLPPVCLRVDPLPKKKNCNGCSRSPSPPSSKKNSPATADGTSKEFSSSSMPDEVQPDLKLQNSSNVSEEVKPKEKSIKLSEKSSGKKGENQKDGSQSQITSAMLGGVHEKSSESTGTEESWTNNEELKIKENKAERKVDSMIEEKATEAREARDSIKGTDDEQRKEKKVFSNVEAAVLIQAAYRGFQVRKWEPLKKLKQIAEVSKHMTDLRGRIQALETSSDFQNDDRQRVTIGETIMRLLLKLDTIQGLHPSFREMRKSLARELTSLQEKLDSIMAKKSQQQMEESSAKKPVEDTPLVAPNGEYTQEQPEEKVAEPGKDSSVGIVHGSHNMSAQCQGQTSMKDGISGYEDEKLRSPVDGYKSESLSEADSVFDEEIEPLPDGKVNECVSHVGTVDAFSESVASETEMAVQNRTKSELEDTPIEVDDLDIKAWKELPLGVIDVEELADDSKMDKQNKTAKEEPQLSEIREMAELPVGLLDYDTVMDGSAHDGASSEIHEMAELPVGLLDEDTLMDGSAHDVASSEIHKIAELPVGLLDDDTATSEVVKHDEAGISKEVLQAVEGECHAAAKPSSSADDISTETQLNQQQLEEQGEEAHSTEKSDGWINIESKNELIGEVTSLDADVECHSRKENEQESVTTGYQCLPSVTKNDGHDAANGEAFSEVNNSQLEPVEFGVHAEQVIDADADHREALALQKSEQSVTSKEQPIPEHDGELNGDKNLIQENEKLRTMMQKLLEAGNEQLTVISNLTGRVKDLEKKLARKKKVRTKQCRPATPKHSSKKSSNNPLQSRAIGVAM